MRFTKSTYLHVVIAVGLKKINQNTSCRQAALRHIELKHVLSEGLVHTTQRSARLCV